jgi:hypothetical protein
VLARCRGRSGTWREDGPHSGSGFISISGSGNSVERWRCVYERAPQDGRGGGRGARKLPARFAELFGRSPTHLDSYQHVDRNEPVGSVLLGAGRELGVPVRELTDSIVYRGDFHGRTHADEPSPGAITVESLLQLFTSLPAGVPELGCHPGAEAAVASGYGAERPLEPNALCDPRVRAAVQAEGITLRSFAVEGPLVGSDSYD